MLIDVLYQYTCQGLHATYGTYANNKLLEILVLGTQVFSRAILVNKAIFTSKNYLLLC